MSHSKLESSYSHYIDSSGILHILDLYGLKSEDDVYLTVTNNVENIVEDLLKSEPHPFKDEFVILYGTDCVVSKFYIKTSKFEQIDLSNSDELGKLHYYYEMIALYN